MSFFKNMGVGIEAHNNQLKSEILQYYTQDFPIMVVDGRCYADYNDYNSNYGCMPIEGHYIHYKSIYKGKVAIGRIMQVSKRNSRSYGNVIDYNLPMVYCYYKEIIINEELMMDETIEDVMGVFEKYVVETIKNYQL